MTYGLPYMGSKSKIAEEILAVLPPAHNFVDLCFGGGAVTHCAMLSRKYKHFIVNDVERYGMDLFCDAIDGKYANETRWVSREEFFALKEIDPYVRICWSFGNDQRTYLYAREIEEYKHCFHMAVVDGNYAPMLERYGLDFSDLDVMGGDLKQRRINTKKIMERYLHEGKLEKKGSHYILRSQQVMEGGADVFPASPLNARINAKNRTAQRMQSRGGVARPMAIHEDTVARKHGLERTDRLKELQTTTFSCNSAEMNVNLQRQERLADITQHAKASDVIERHLGDYQDVAIPDDSVVICDIPYKDTERYQDNEGNVQTFDHERYYEWVRNHDRLIFTCEYQMPDDFVPIWKRERVSTLCATNNSLRKIENIFVHRSKLHLYQSPKPSLFGFDELNEM